jgi:hypothetical protein
MRAENITAGAGREFLSCEWRRKYLLQNFLSVLECFEGRLAF